MRSKALDQLSPLAFDLREENPDRYLATLFAPPAHRDALFALYAFDNELARVQTIVTEPMAGLVRLQWWQDVIDGFGDGFGAGFGNGVGRGGTVSHPVVKGLKRAVDEDGLDPVYLRRALDGRRRPFEDDPPSDLGSFERYLLDIGGSISCAALSLLGSNAREILAVAEGAGLVSAAWQQLRLLERSTPDRPTWLPAAWLEGSVEATRDHLAEWALTRLAEARRQRPSIPRPLLAAFFSGTLAGVRLRDPIRSSQRPNLPSAVPRLAWCWLRARF